MLSRNRSKRIPLAAVVDRRQPRCAPPRLSQFPSSCEVRCIRVRAARHSPRCRCSRPAQDRQQKLQHALRAVVADRGRCSSRRRRRHSLALRTSPPAPRPVPRARARCVTLALTPRQQHHRLKHSRHSRTTAQQHDSSVAPAVPLPNAQPHQPRQPRRSSTAQSRQQRLAHHSTAALLQR
jgi:hypothetical protein